MRRVKSCLIAMVAALAAAPAAAADNQLRVFLGATFNGQTTFVVNLDKAASRPNVVVGVSMVTLGEVLGVDVDLADAPGFFEAGDQRLVLSSRVTTLTGNVMVAAPRRLTEYSLRPYLVGGAGLMRVRADDYFGAFRVASLLPAWDVGAGAAGFVTNTVGVAWEVRRFQSLSRETEQRGLTFGKEQLSFWRASMSLAIRY